MGDLINHPAHYKSAGGIEAIDVIESFGLGFHLGNVVKYVLRAGRKEEIVKDLRKARWYLDRKVSSLLAAEEGYAADDLSHYSLVYLATPYTKWNDLDAAAAQAAVISADLFTSGVKVFSPIVLGHQMAILGNLAPRDPEIWPPFCEPFIEACDALCVARMDGWKESNGIAAETIAFEAAGKPVFDLDPQSMKVTRRASK